MASLTGNRLGLLLASLMLFSGLLYHETVIAVWTLWNSDNNPTYSHGPLLLLVCIYIIYREWRENREDLNLKISYFGLIGIVGSSLLWFVAGLGSVQIIQMLSLISLLAFMFVAVLGYRQAKLYLFPILLMIGALPVWGVFGHYLQVNSAVVAGWLTTLTIRPSIREGMLIHIPAGSFEVGTGCSGLAYFIVSIIISLLFVFDRRMAIRRALVFVLVAMTVAIVANIIRVYIIILSGQLTDMQSYFITEEHVSLGWVIFAIGITVYLWQAGRFVSIRESQGGESRDCGERQPAVQSGRTWAMAVSMVAVAVIVGPLASEAYSDNAAQARSYSVQLPDEVNGWKKIPYAGAYRPIIQKGDVTQEASFVDSSQDSNIYLMVNYFYRQKQGAEAVSDMNRFANGRKWSRVESQVISFDVDGFTDIGETKLRARNGEEKLVWYWYETNNTRSSINWIAKLQNIVGILKGHPSIHMVVLAIEPKSGITDARMKLRAFLQEIDTKIRIVSPSV